jgi:large subunit ribosomal protein L5
VAETRIAQINPRISAEKKSAAISVPRLAQLYTKDIVPALQKRFGRSNRLAVARLVKIVVNVGCGEAAHEAKVLEEAQRDLGLITGQRPLITRAKKAVSNFKIKEGDPVGCKTTLRRGRMYEFLERLIVMVLPRVRDFRGLSLTGFDRSGNYSFGLPDKTIFPELRLDDVHYALGMDITLVTTARAAEEARALLEAYGLPFEKKQGA